MFYNGAPSADTVKLYINGELQTLTKKRTPNPVSRFATTTAFFSGWGWDGDHRFNGSLDDMRIYNRELTADEIARLVDLPNNQFTYDAAGQLLSVIDPLGRTTSYAYDGLGRQIETTLPDPDGDDPTLDSPVLTTHYNVAGQVIQSIDPLLNVTSYQYDHLGRPTKTILPDPDGSSGNPEIESFYDAAGQLTRVEDPDDNATTYDYDGLGRQVRVTSPDPDGQGGQDPATQEAVYDVLGRTIAQIDPLGNATTLHYDGLSRLVLQVDALGGETGYTYDLLGNRLSLTDPEGNTTAWVYDDLNRMIEETNQLDDTRYFTYNAAGLLTRRVDRLDRVREFEYDNLYRNTAEYWYTDETEADADPDHSSPDDALTFAYDLAGQLAR